MTLLKTFELRNTVFEYRTATETDLPDIDRLAIGEHFNVGYTNLKVYFKHSHASEWHIIRNADGELVAFHIMNRMSNGLMMGFQILVREDYRGWGLTRHCDTMYSSEGLGNATQDSILRYPFGGFMCKLVGYFGVVRVNLIPSNTSSPDGVAIREFNSQHDLNAVLEYDRPLTKGVNRSNFVRDWCGERNDDTAYTAVAYSNQHTSARSKGRLVGYGTLRQFHGWKAIMPVYANEPATALALLYALAARADLSHIYLMFPAFQRVCFEFCRRVDQ